MVTLDLFIGRCYAVKYHNKASLKRCKMAKIINREVVSDSYRIPKFRVCQRWSVVVHLIIISCLNLIDEIKIGKLRCAEECDDIYPVDINILFP